MSLRDILSTKVSQYDDVDTGWRTFVRDHREELLRRSTLNELTADKAQQVNYNSARFFRDIGYRPDFVWIAMYVNGLACDADFVNIRAIYVPDVNYIMELYAQYRITKAAELR